MTRRSTSSIASKRPGSRSTTPRHRAPALAGTPSTRSRRRLGAPPLRLRRRGRLVGAHLRPVDLLLPAPPARPAEQRRPRESRGAPVRRPRRLRGDRECGEREEHGVVVDPPAREVLPRLLTLLERHPGGPQLLVGLV